MQLPLSVWEAGYSKDQEAEADGEGMMLATVSGYSPYGAVTMFQKFEKLQHEHGIHALARAGVVTVGDQQNRILRL